MKVLAFGEILYDVDVKADLRNIGGASLNFVAHLSKLGENGYIMSSVGDDELGKEAMACMEKFGLNTKYVDINREYQTGQALVTYENGEPSYDLSMISAYDNIKASKSTLDDIKNEKFDVLYYGTLAQRNECSKTALANMIEQVDFDVIFYDVNLRQTYYTKDIIESGMKNANIVKVNRDELKFIMDMECLRIDDYKALCQKFDIEYLIVTKDKDGAEAYELKKDKLYVAGQQKGTLISAVGAGDSFSACFVHNLFNGVDIETCLNRANILGAYVIGQKAAVPDYPPELLEKISAI